MQHLVAEIVVYQSTHERFALLLRRCARVVAGLHVEERLAEQFYPVSLRTFVSGDGAALYDIGISLLRSDRLAGLDVALESDGITELTQELLFECAQDARRLSRRLERRKRRGIDAEQSLVRIVPRQELQ